MAYRRAAAGRDRTGSGAIPQVESLTVLELLEAANGAEPATISALLAAERGGKNRATAVDGLEKLLAR